MTVPGVFMRASSTSAADRNSRTPWRVSSSRIGPIRNSGYTGPSLLVCLAVHTTTAPKGAIISARRRPATKIIVTDQTRRSRTRPCHSRRRRHPPPPPPVPVLLLQLLSLAHPANCSPFAFGSSYRKQHFNRPHKPDSREGFRLRCCCLAILIEIGSNPCSHVVQQRGRPQGEPVEAVHAQRSARALRDPAERRSGVAVHHLRALGVSGSPAGCGTGA